MLKKYVLVTFAAVLAVPTVAQEGVIAIGVGEREFPESITSTSDGTLYTGSLTQGTIFKVAPGAKQSEVFIGPPETGPIPSFGVYADEANGTLWVCYADRSSFSNSDAEPSVLTGYDLVTGDHKVSAQFSGPSLCNDIATTADGTAFAADTVSARVIRVSPGSDVAETWISDPQLAGADGLAFGADGALYLNSVTTNKLFRIEVAEDGSAGAVTELTVSVPLDGADGMRSGPDGKLYLVENKNGRVSELTIEGDTATVRDLGAPEMVGPTALTLVGDILYVLEARIGLSRSEENPGVFHVYPVSID